MGTTVNRIGEVAADWQRHVVWIRVNVSYIRAELRHLWRLGHDVGDIKELTDSFDLAFERFCNNEMAVFTVARLSETDEGKKHSLIGQLRRLRASFEPWLRDYNALVEAKRVDPQAQQPLVLLHGCGAELLAAHARFVGGVDAYIDELEPDERLRPDEGSSFVAGADFVCCLCDRWAGSLQLFGPPNKGRLMRQSFTSRMSGAVQPQRFEALRSALESSDVLAVYGLDLEYAPFYCPSCHACYCGDHWDRWDVYDEDSPSFHDCVKGRCPSGHTRMLED